MMRSLSLKAAVITAASVATSIGMVCATLLGLGMPLYPVAMALAVICPLLITPAIVTYTHHQESRLAALIAELELAKDELARRASHDGLTGLLNRMAFMARAEEAWRPLAPGALMLIDADRFKAVNDVHGHLTGDAALVAIADAVRSVTGTAGIAGRVGGEEFAVFLPDARPDEATNRAEEIRRRIEASVVTAPSGERVTVTVSIGLSLTDQAARFIEVYARADSYLYLAKQRGRNRAMGEQAA